ncbi:hypothetical protein ACFLQU_05270, partial [Verrucomicrobiota bacterium]
GIARSKTYLEKACGVDFPMKHWSAMQKLNRVRNCIVHAEGDIERARSPDKLEHIVGNTKHLKLKNSRDLQIEDGYLADNVDRVEHFLLALYKRAFPKSSPCRTP